VSGTVERSARYGVKIAVRDERSDLCRATRDKRLSQFIAAFASYIFSLAVMGAG